MTLCLYESASGIAHIQLNRPEVRNALNVALLKALVAALQSAYDDDATVALLSGAGRTFCAGADRREKGPGGSPSMPERRTLINEAVERLSEFPMAIAAVQGAAVGGGWALALACDVCITESDCKFVLPELEYGIPFVDTTLADLTAWLGPGSARAVALTGEVVTGARLAALGAAIEAIDTTALGEAQALATRMAGRDPRLLRTAKRRVRAWRPGT